ncbi:hypothetical protein EDB85DRAFT_1923450 [Lactarius pseudohatsudake]|nr:hypothetical protein EDB85DRAFT_1923450 [Lactarius pseudohatsudake]
MMYSPLLRSPSLGIAATVRTAMCWDFYALLFPPFEDGVCSMYFLALRRGWAVAAVHGNETLSREPLSRQEQVCFSPCHGYCSISTKR